LGYNGIVQELEWKKDPTSSHADRVFFKNETNPKLLKTGAILTLIAMVEHDRPHLLTHGNCNPAWPRPELCDAKYQITLGDPVGTTEALRADWRSSVGTLDTLQGMIAKTPTRQWMIVDFNEEKCVRSSMPIFKKRVRTLFMRAGSMLTLMNRSTDRNF
jgi:hypothetical protein